MSKEPRKQKNPFDNIKKSLMLTRNQIDSLISNPEKLEAAVADLKANQSQAIPDEVAADQKLSSSVALIIKLLKKYPGFESGILASLKLEIKTAETYGTIDKFKQSIKPTGQGKGRKKKGEEVKE